LKKIVLAVLAAVALSACSTIVEGTTQNVTVMTEPSGANCGLRTSQGTVAVVNPTPGTVQLSKSKEDVSVLLQQGRLPERRGYAEFVL
jgi:hypothetical protein